MKPEHQIDPTSPDIDVPEKEGRLIYEKTSEGRRKWPSVVMGGIHRLSSPRASDFDTSYEIEKNINMQVRHQIE